MTDPYVSFDTFSVGAESGLPGDSAPVTPQRPSLLARLPRVVPPPRPKTRKRFDEAESYLTGTHLAEGGADVAFAGAGPVAEPATMRLPLTNPTATLRVDTVVPDRFDDDAPTYRAARQASAAAPRLEAASETTAVDDPWTSWLMNLESAILPYSRIIVLAAVIAAMGLTLVLLRGARGAAGAPSPDPQVRIETTNDLLADIESADSTTIESAPAWPNASRTAPELRPLEDVPFGGAGSTPPALASGPASARPRLSGASLTGQVFPVDDERVDVADAAGQPAYPRTTR